MFLAPSNAVFPTENTFMKPNKSAFSHEYQIPSTLPKHLDENYTEEIYGPGVGSGILSQRFPPSYNSIESPNLSYAEEGLVQRVASNFVAYGTDNSNYIKAENVEPAVLQEYGNESPLQAFQSFNTVGLTLAQDHYKKQNEPPIEVLNPVSVQYESFDYQRNPEFPARRDFPDYGFSMRQKPEEEQIPIHMMQQFPPPNQMQLVPQPQYLEEAKPLLLPHSIQQQTFEYPDMTTMINASSEIVGPMVEMQFVDSKVCQICNKRITRDMCRHMRTHQAEKRFVCVFPRHTCGNKSNQFNRRYDYTKHLLNRHFVYDNPQVVKSQTLRDKVSHWGTCACGQRFLAQDWLDWHVLTKDEELKCPLIRAERNI